MQSPRILAKFRLEKATAEELIAYAVDAVRAGSNAKNMILLAGEWPTTNMEELQRLFAKALRDSGIALPTREEAIDDRFEELLQAIASGKVTPYRGAKAIQTDVYDEMNGHELDDQYVGECLDIGDILSAMYAYGDLQEPNIEYEGRLISKAEADRMLDELVITNAKRLLEKRKHEDSDPMSM